MPKVTFLPQNITVEFEPGKLPYLEHGLPESLLDIALNCGVHLEHACGGNCACTTCHVKVKAGKENLSEMQEDEMDRLDTAADLSLNSRLGCQCIVKGDVVVEIPAWNRNYISEGGASILGDAIPPPKNQPPMSKIPKLTDTEIVSALTSLSGWTIVNGKLHREYKFADFTHAFGFMATAATAIEAMNHHPEWFNVWNRVTVDLTTHDAGGLSAKDVELAKKLDLFAAKLQG